MSQEVLNFGRYLKECREELNINQKEAAYLLGIVPNTYSNYERCDRPIPMHYLPKIKKLFNIPDDVFLDMLLDRPRTKKRETPEEAAIRLKDMHAQYIVGVTESLYDMIDESPELRQLLGFLQSMESKKRRNYLISLRNVLEIYDTLLTAHAKKGSQTDYITDPYIEDTVSMKDLDYLVNNSVELRNFHQFIQKLDSKNRRLYLNAVRQILMIYDDLLDAEANDLSVEYRELDE